MLNVKDVTKHDLEGVELLVVGSPTRAFRPTKAIVTFLNRLPARSLKNIKTAAGTNPDIIIPALYLFLKNNEIIAVNKYIIIP